VPRLPGLYVFTALASRGITWSALGAQVLASSITGAPQPLESSLLDAIDPARFVARRVRRSSGGGSASATSANASAGAGPGSGA
jgi:tRNA 5-methylaminomethyl-2-thiouridine biosynthesis bifunctional protein